DRARRDNPFRSVAGIFVVAPALGPVHRDVVDLLDQRALVVMRDENVWRRHGHDIRDADRAGPAEREAAPALALQADHVGIAVAIDLNAPGEEFVTDKI